MAKPKSIQRYRDNLQGELDSAALYRALAEIEEDKRLSTVYARLATVEEAHADFWKKKLDKSGVKPPPARVGWRTRLLIRLARRFGPELVLPTVRTLEKIDSGRYDTQADARSAGMPAEEQSHARLLDALSGTPGISGGTISRLEGRHRQTGGNALRAAVLGLNDGLVSNLSLVMAAAGAAFAERTVLITGIAGLLAGSCSMAMGEWLSVQSSRELYEKQIATEKGELAAVPDEEKEELVLIYQTKGLSEEQARSVAERVMQDPKQALDTLAREELGIDPEELGGSARTAAVTSFVLFCLGAIVPVLPYFMLARHWAVIASIALSGAALFGTGAAITLFTGRSVLFSGTRQLAIGLAAAAVTFAVGRMLGVSLGG